MIKRFDHVTVAVEDLDRATAFFALLGFAEERTVVISGKKFSDYMGVDGIEAEHVTLALAGGSHRIEVQLLKYRRPPPLSDGAAGRLDKLGFNHICFAVDDVAAEAERLQASGVRLRNRIMEFHERKLVFLEGPEGIVVELSEQIASGR